jgi:hypothetical protein
VQWQLGVGEDLLMTRGIGETLKRCIQYWVCSKIFALKPEKNLLAQIFRPSFLAYGGSGWEVFGHIFIVGQDPVILNPAGYTVTC